MARRRLRKKIPELCVALEGRIRDHPRFLPAQHLASGAGLCPGNNESAGKRKRGKTRKGSLGLRRALSQAAWAASRTKATYLAARHHRRPLGEERNARSSPTTCSKPIAPTKIAGLTISIDSMPKG